MKTFEVKLSIILLSGRIENPPFLTITVKAKDQHHAVMIATCTAILNFDDIKISDVEVKEHV